MDACCEDNVVASIFLFLSSIYDVAASFVGIVSPVIRLYTNIPYSEWMDLLAAFTTMTTDSTSVRRIANRREYATIKESTIYYYRSLIQQQTILERTTETQWYTNKCFARYQSRCDRVRYSLDGFTNDTRRHIVQVILDARIHTQNTHAYTQLISTQKAKQY